MKVLLIPILLQYGCGIICAKSWSSKTCIAPRWVCVCQRDASKHVCSDGLF